MLLERYLPIGDLGKIAKSRALEFAVGDHILPFFAAYLSLIGLYPIQPESKMSFVLYQPDHVPFSHGLGFGDGGISRHVIETSC